MGRIRVKIFWRLGLNVKNEAYMKNVSIVTISIILLMIIFSVNTRGEESQKLEQEFKNYSNEKWGISFKLPSSWDIFSNEDVTQKTHGLWNVPDAIVIVANKTNPDENFFIKASHAPGGIIPKETLREMINSLDQEYPKHYQGFKKISAQLIEKAGGVGVEYIMDNEWGTTELRQKIILLIKNAKSFIWTFTSPKSKYDAVNKLCFDPTLNSLKIE